MEYRAEINAREDMMREMRRKSIEKKKSQHAQIVDFADDLVNENISFVQFSEYVIWILNQ